MSPRHMSLLQGTLDVLVMKAVADEARHGYGVAEWIRRTTDGTLEIEDGAMTASARLRLRGKEGAQLGSQVEFTDLDLEEAEGGPLETSLALPVGLDTALFLLRTPRAGGPLDYWRAIESERKHPWRIARHLGVATLARYVAGTLTRDAALALLSRRAGARVGHVMLDDPSAAVDVDTCADLALAERILRVRESARQ